MVLKLLFSLVIIRMLTAFGVLAAFGVLPSFGVLGGGRLIGSRLFSRFGFLFFSLATAAAGPHCQRQGQQQ